MAELWEVDPGALSDAELSAHVGALDAERCRVEAAMAKAVAAWDARKVWVYDGATSGAAWLAHRCELSRSSAAVIVRTARVALDAAQRRSLGLGSHLTPEGVLLASAAHRTEKTLDAFARDEAVLVEHACRLTVDQTAQMLQHWLLRADLDLGRTPVEGDRLHVSSTFAGATVLDGVYASDDGEVVRAAVEAEAERLRKAERASGELVRTAAQRRAAALAELLRRAVGAHVGRPTIAVTMSLADLEERSGPGRVDETGTPISAEATRRLACDANVVRVVTKGASEPLDVGRASRVISPAQRRALALRDHGCVFPGCDRPPGWCDGHHIVHWADGGPTNLPNLVLLRLSHEHAAAAA